MSEEKSLTTKATKPAKNTEKKTKGFLDFAFLGDLGVLGGSFLLIGALLAGCSKGKGGIPDVADNPLTAPVTVMNLPETAPAYGISTGGAFEVNLEAEDGSQVREGQRALVRMDSMPSPLECRVTGVIRNANLATGQSIAWLKPVEGKGLPAGEFVSAEIVLGMKYRVSALPWEAIYIRDGKSMVLLKRTAKDGTTTYMPTPVETGVATDTDVEIVSGVKPGDEVATQAGIGYLYSDFKANAED